MSLAKEHLDQMTLPAIHPWLWFFLHFQSKFQCEIKQHFPSNSKVNPDFTEFETVVALSVNTRTVTPHLYNRACRVHALVVQEQTVVNLNKLGGLGNVWETLFCLLTYFSSLLISVFFWQWHHDRVWVSVARSAHKNAHKMFTVQIVGELRWLIIKIVVVNLIVFSIKFVIFTNILLRLIQQIWSHGKISYMIKIRLIEAYK